MLHILAEIEPRLRWLLPADLYAAVWISPTQKNLTRVFEHLRTLLNVMHGYIPRQVIENPPTPGKTCYEWQEGTLMFTDLAGFTQLMEANVVHGRAGAEALLDILNAYFAEIIEIITKAGGNLLEFTGDALLAQFPPGPRRNDPVRAIRAGLRMQRAMARFAHIETSLGVFGLGMRIGIHSGRFMTADIGTPRRMEHILLGTAVHRTKLAEGAGQVGRVCLTEDARARVADQFRFEPSSEGHVLVVDDLSDEQLGDYDLLLSRRMAGPVLLDRRVEGLVNEIYGEVRMIEPLASYLPMPILQLLVESASARHIVPDFLQTTVLFVNLVGLAETVDDAPTGSEGNLVDRFSHIFALINAIIEARGGVLKKVTFHLIGSDVMIYFGPPSGHSDDPTRAANAALEIQAAIAAMNQETTQHALKCKMGLANGMAFAAEIGTSRGRREFNVLGDTVNTAARLMGRADEGQILLAGPVCERIAQHLRCEALGSASLRGKSNPVSIFALHG